MSAPAGPRVEHIDCGPLTELEDGRMTLVDGPNGKDSIGLFRRGETVYALRNWCPHNGAPVCLGPVTGTNVSKGGFDVEHVREGEILKCPWHKWEFELETGLSITKPVKKVETYPVKIENDRVYVVVRRLRKRKNVESTDN